MKLDIFFLTSEIILFCNATNKTPTLKEALDRKFRFVKSFCSSQQKIEQIVLLSKQSQTLWHLKLVENRNSPQIAWEEQWVVGAAAAEKKCIFSVPL